MNSHKDKALVYDKKIKQRAEAIHDLKGYLREDMIVYTIVRHCSRSGMTRHISVLIFKKGQPIFLDYLVAKILGLRIAPNCNGVITSSLGEDAPRHLVYDMAHVILGDGLKVKHYHL